MVRDILTISTVRPLSLETSSGNSKGPNNSSNVHHEKQDFLRERQERKYFKEEHGTQVINQIRDDILPAKERGSGSIVCQTVNRTTCETFNLSSTPDCTTFTSFDNYSWQSNRIVG